MIALFTFRPNYCPNCGRPITHDAYTRADFRSLASFSCPDCGLDYQRIGEEAALHAAEAAGGGLARMRRAS